MLNLEAEVALQLLCKISSSGCCFQKSQEFVRVKSQPVQ